MSCPNDIHANRAETFRTLKICAAPNHSRGYESRYRLIHEHEFSKIMDTTPTELFASHVQNVLLGCVSNEFTMRLLSVCTGVQNLFIFPIGKMDREMTQLIQRLPLRSLNCRRWDTLQAFSEYGCQLSQVVYLETTSYDNEDTEFPSLSCFPNLTHVTIDAEEMDVEMHSVDMVKIAKAIFSTAPQLRKLVINCKSESNKPWEAYEYAVENFEIWKAIDPRVEVRYELRDPIQAWEERVSGVAYPDSIFFLVAPDISEYPRSDIAIKIGDDRGSHPAIFPIPDQFYRHNYTPTTPGFAKLLENSLTIAAEEGRLKPEVIQKDFWMFLDDFQITKSMTDAGWFRIYLGEDPYQVRRKTERIMKGLKNEFASLKFGDAGAGWYNMYLGEDPEPARDKIGKITESMEREFEDDETVNTGWYKLYLGNDPEVVKQKSEMIIKFIENDFMNEDFGKGLSYEFAAKLGELINSVCDDPSMCSDVCAGKVIH